MQLMFNCWERYGGSYLLFCLLNAWMSKKSDSSENNILRSIFSSLFICWSIPCAKAKRWDISPGSKKCNSRALYGKNEWSLRMPNTVLCAMFTFLAIFRLLLCGSSTTCPNTLEITSSFRRFEGHPVLFRSCTDPVSLNFLIILKTVEWLIGVRSGYSLLNISAVRRAELFLYKSKILMRCSTDKYVTIFEYTLSNDRTYSDRIYRMAKWNKCHILHVANSETLAMIKIV